MSQSAMSIKDWACGISGVPCCCRRYQSASRSRQDPPIRSGSRERSDSPTALSKPCGVIMAAPAMPTWPSVVVKRSTMLDMYCALMPSAQV